MSNSCFIMLIASAAICYGIGAMVGAHIIKSTMPKKNKRKIKKDTNKRTNANKYGMK